MSGYAYTDHSLPLIISGEWYENKEPFLDYQIRIFKNSPFFEYLKKQDYTLSYYEDEYKFEVGVMDGAFNNLAYTQSSLWDAPLFNKRIIKMVGMKYAPYLLKPKCWFNVDMLNNQEMTPKDEELFSWKNKAFYDDLKEDDFTTLSGLAIFLIGRVPKAGDIFSYKNLEFEIVDMDRGRVDKLLVVKRDDNEE